jgi:UDP-2-acetamido-2,6-beta-L-arabino-hexul-4-ose reductase
MIAKAFPHYQNSNNVLIFASGVANSSESNINHFMREQIKILNAIMDHKDKFLVYFSTCSTEDKDVFQSPYVLHKLKIEQIITSMHAEFLIFRLPQVVGKSTNRTTLVNYLYDNIVNETHFTLWEDAVRYLIDVDDVVKIVSFIIDNKLFCNKILNVAALRYSVLDIVRCIEKITDKQAHYDLIERGTPFEIDLSEIKPVIRDLNLRFDKYYLENTLKKYCS